MKKVLILIITLISSISYAKDGLIVEWGDVHWGDYFKLDQEIQLENGPLIPAGGEFKFNYEIGLPPTNVIVIELTDLTCTDDNFEMEDVTLVQPKGAGNIDRRVWVRPTKGCNFEVYVEASDYYSISFFRESRVIE